METLSGQVENISYQNEENGYTVARIKITGIAESQCIVGSMPALQSGEGIEAKGKWLVHPQYGRQFQVEKYQVKAPSDLKGIQKYLESGLIKGIGPVYAKKIIEVFGLETLEMIDQRPELLANVPGIGKKRIEQIRHCWQDQKSIRKVMIFLHGHGISPGFAQKIFKKYGQQSIDKLQENPYRLSQDLFGVGFKNSDQIAEKMGIGKDHPRRIEAGIEFLLQKLCSEGHACYPLNELSLLLKDLLELDEKLFVPCFENLNQNERVVISKLIMHGSMKEFIWLKPLYQGERGIAREIQRLRKHDCSIRQINTEKAISWVQEQLKIELAEEQINALRQALVEKFSIITGGPGTGKSTLTKAILSISSHLCKDIQLTAPTGRAAKRMSEICKRPAKTIHSLLEYDFKTFGFKRRKDNPLECQLIIIDEASMIDTQLMYSLLKAIPDHTRVIFVGDINQLPSVGPGNVLKDMIESMRLKVIELNEIFRQAKGSLIISNAHRINKGNFPEIENKADDDFFFVQAEEKEQVLDQIIHLVSSRIPRKYAFNCFEDIQVLAPMKKGLIGTENINMVLQKLLNPQDSSIYRAGNHFKVKDKVMQIRNNYQKSVYNGDVGRIETINADEQILQVCFDDQLIDYAFHELDELVLAYAISVHKYQGSECPCIIMPIHTAHFKLLHRNLLYTGLTRGKKIVILVGTKKALTMAIKNNEVKKRHTSLKEAILALP